MTSPRPHFATFRERLLAGQRLLGTFLKLPTTQVIEILGPIGYDFVIIDQEHAALDRGVTDLMILAARAANIAPVVRIPEFTESFVLGALDSGAMGIMVPHVTSVEKARAVARSARYKGGSRGFAGLTRASNWGSIGAVGHMAAQDAQVAVIAMIEDKDAAFPSPPTSRGSRASTPCSSGVAISPHPSAMTRTPARRSPRSAAASRRRRAKPACP